MNKKILLLTFFVFALLLIFVGLLLLFANSPKHGLLKINGVDITEENVIIHSNYAELPFTEVLKNLGMNVDWIDKNTAEITYNDKEYILNTSEAIFYETSLGPSYNLLIAIIGGERYYKPLEKELILDDATIKGVLFQMGIDIYFDFDSKEQVVNVTGGNPRETPRTQGDGSPVLSESNQ